MPEVEITTRSIGGHWHMVVKDRGREVTRPAASKLEAELMARLERRDRGLPSSDQTACGNLI